MRVMLTAILVSALLVACGPGPEDTGSTVPRPARFVLVGTAYNGTCRLNCDVLGAFKNAGDLPGDGAVELWLGAKDPYLSAWSKCIVPLPVTQPGATAEVGCTLIAVHIRGRAWLHARVTDLSSEAATHRHQVEEEQRRELEETARSTVDG